MRILAGLALYLCISWFATRAEENNFFSQEEEEEKVVLEIYIYLKVDIME